jgi:hypothetical protein
MCQDDYKYYLYSSRSEPFLYQRIISLIEGGAYKLLLFIKVPVPKKESERSFFDCSDGLLFCFDFSL